MGPVARYRNRRLITSLLFVAGGIAASMAFGAANADILLHVWQRVLLGSIAGMLLLLAAFRWWQTW
jgi:hypothetical protein